MNLEAILTIAFFVILISIQYTLNKILSEVKNIRKEIDRSTELAVKRQKAKGEYDSIN